MKATKVRKKAQIKSEVKMSVCTSYPSQFITIEPLFSMIQTNEEVKIKTKKIYHNIVNII